MSDAKQSVEASSPGIVDLPEEKTRLTTLAVQLVVIPLAVVLFCVALAGLFVWLTTERKGLDDYLNALRASSGLQRSQQAQYLLNYIQDSKRWQGIFDVSARISANRDDFLAKNPHAVADITQVFEESKGEDPRTRRYLALVLGLLGDHAALPSLRDGLNDGDAETVKNCIWALGRIGDDESASAIIKLTHSDEQSVRLMAVYVLGSMNNPQAASVLEASLNDPDELVKWNAAFGLANKGNPAAVNVLARLLDKEYVDRVTGLMPKEGRPLDENIQRYRMAAVVWVAKLDPTKARPLLDKLSVSEPDLQVRNAAIQQLNKLNHKQ
ncbi:MAG TPA: HEAT repeat domain-containing protein [Verrucomicrobiae bacterium]|nr:HEAT repeat domain-containing protein [Verrucomicrobiae bacterium]